MKKIIELLTEEFVDAFSKCGYDTKYAKVGVSNRPDLCEFQCSAALAAAKEYKKAPIQIANEIVEVLKDNKKFESIEAIMPGFINLNISSEYLAEYVSLMKEDEKFGYELIKDAKKTVIDYGGPNVAKPLHVGHLRPAIIGESLKRLCRYAGDDVVGDAHLGDWGLPIGLVITELKKRKPELVYFDDAYSGEYPSEPPFDVSELEEIYPFASAKSKEDDAFKEEARLATVELQNGKKGYRALWEHILNVSVVDLEKNYDKLNVHFDVWGKESDAKDYIPEMVSYLKDNKYAVISEGALVVEVKEETDTKEMPPCMILKSDGGTLYDTTDLATIVERMKLYNPDEIIYVVDKRQDLYFERVFRCAKKTKLVNDNTDLIFKGFGTMNGKDGKPFKTRDGGVMRLEKLIEDIEEKVYAKIMQNRTVEEKEARDTAKKVGLAALKYGDLSNQASKDYVFDIERFISFEGNTGPYILYTIVRINGIIEKYNALNKNASEKTKSIMPPSTKVEKELMLDLTKFNQMIEEAHEELAPHKICAFIYNLSNSFNKFYHETKIISEENEEKRDNYIRLITLTKEMLKTCIDLLAFDAPERM